VSNLKWTFLFALAVWGGLFAAAYAVAPKSCQGGLEDYFFAGVAATFVLVAMPLFAHPAIRLWKRALFSVNLGVLTAAIWLGGLFAANVQFVCRLF
jgi:hypothetical protein